MAVPPSVSVRTWSVSKVEPAPVLTVTMEVPPASSSVCADTSSDSTGNASSSATVTVSCEPTAGAEPPVPRFASMRIVSLGSSILSCTAVTVVVMDEGAVPTPAGRVRVLD